MTQKSVSFSVSQCVLVCHSVFQSVPEYFSVLQFFTKYEIRFTRNLVHSGELHHSVKFNKIRNLSDTTTHCNTLNTLEHIVTHCNTLQYTITHCKTLKHIGTYSKHDSFYMRQFRDHVTVCYSVLKYVTRHDTKVGVLYCVPVCCSVVQCVVVCCSLFQCTPVCCSVSQDMNLDLLIIQSIQEKFVIQSNMERSAIYQILQHTVTHYNTL